MMTIETVRERLAAARAWWRGSALGRVEVLLGAVVALALARFNGVTLLCGRLSRPISRR